MANLVRKKICFIIGILLILFFLSPKLFAEKTVLKDVEILMLKGAYAQAAKRCNQVISQQRSTKITSQAHYLLGICLLKETKYKKARKSFNKVLRRYAKSKFCDDAKLGVADSYFLAGEFKQATKEYEEFLQYFSRSELTEIARRHLGQCLQGRRLSDSFFSVQVGCFDKSKNAQRLRDKLIDSGFRAYLLRYPEDSFYRVRIGKFDNRSEAEWLEEKLKAIGYSTKVCP